MSLQIEDRQIRPSRAKIPKVFYPARLRLQYRSSPEQPAVRWGRSLLKSLRGLHPNTVATSFFTSDQARLPKGSISIGIQRENFFFFLISEQARWQIAAEEPNKGL